MEIKSPKFTYIYSCCTIRTEDHLMMVFAALGSAAIPAATYKVGS